MLFTVIINTILSCMMMIQLSMMKWHTQPESDAIKTKYWASAGNLWNETPGVKADPGVWYLDEVVFTTNIHDGSYVATGIEGISRVLQIYNLRNGYPNPFNPSTIIQFTIPVSNNVKIEIFNIAGQKVKTLLNEHRLSGTHRVIWNAHNDAEQQVASGMYFVRMNASHYVKTNIIIFIK